MNSFTILALASLASAQNSVVYGPCNPTNYRLSSYANQSFPIVPALVQGGIVISGDFFIIDGCNFGLRNFTGYNFHQTKLYGSFPGSTGDAMLLSNTDLTPTATPSTLQFVMRSDAGAQANFNGFSEVRFFEVALNTIIATVTLPSISTTGSGSSTTGSTTGTSATGSKNSAESVFGVSDALGFALAVIPGLFFL